MKNTIYLRDFRVVQFLVFIFIFGGIFLGKTPFSLPLAYGDEEFPFYDTQKKTTAPLDLKKFYVDPGFGVASVRGSIGIGALYFINSKWDVHLNYGSDYIKTLALGFNYHYFLSVNDIFYGGLNYLYSFSGNNTISTSVGNGNYSYESGSILEPTLGFAKKFIFDKFYWGVELNYRYWMTKPKYKYDSGAFSQDHMDDFNKSNSNMIAFGIYLLIPIF